MSFSVVYLEIFLEKYTFINFNLKLIFRMVKNLVKALTVRAKCYI